MSVAGLSNGCGARCLGTLQREAAPGGPTDCDSLSVGGTQVIPTHS